MKKLRDVSSVSSIVSNIAGRPVKIALIVLSLASVLFPIYWLVTSSLKMSQEYIAYPPVLVPTKVVTDSYLEVFTRDKLGTTFMTSLVVAMATTVISVLFGSMAAYTLSRGRISAKARAGFGLWFLIQKMYPAIATAIPIYLVMRALRLMDTQAALIIINTSFNLPLVIWLMMGFFEQLPHALEESAMLDGCSYFKRFFLIILPLTKPGLIAAGILTYVATWNEFLFAVILSIKNTRTLPVVIAGFITDRGLAWGPMAAAAVIMLIPVVLLAWVVQRDFVQGLAMGAVKG